MKLHVTDSSEYVDLLFGQWLCSQIKNKLLSQINSYELTKLDEYLTTEDLIPKLYSRRYFAKDIILQGSQHLVCTGDSGNFFIHVDENVFASGFDRVKLVDLCKLINYGTLNLKGCSIFTDVFQYFSDNLTTYLHVYYQV